MNIRVLIVFGLALFLMACEGRDENTEFSGNPVFPGWYADPEGIIFDDEYWIYPTYSDHYGDPDCIPSDQVGLIKGID